MPSVTRLQPIMERTLQQFLLSMRREWKLGRHVAIVGPTEAGKTHLAADLLALRDYVVIVTIKVNDRTLKRFADYYLLSDWKRRRAYQTHVLYWPFLDDLHDVRGLKQAVFEAVNSIFKSGRWTLCFDDLRVVCDQVGLKADIATMYVFVRSDDTTLVGLFQRPVWVCKESYEQVWYWLLFYISSDDDLKILAKASNTDVDLLRYLNNQLREFDFIVISRSRDSQPYIVRRDTAA